jgi:hypothetical protein
MTALSPQETWLILAARARSTDFTVTAKSFMPPRSRNSGRSRMLQQFRNLKFAGRGTKRSFGVLGPVATFGHAAKKRPKRFDNALRRVRPNGPLVKI